MHMQKTPYPSEIWDSVNEFISVCTANIPALAHTQISTAAFCSIVCMCAVSVARSKITESAKKSERLCCSIRVYKLKLQSVRMRMSLISVLQHSSVDGFVEPPVPPTKSASRHSLPRCRNSFTSTEEHPHIGNYRLLKTIGKGNFAKVKLARHVLTGREVSFYLNLQFFHHLCFVHPGTYYSMSASLFYCCSQLRLQLSLYFHSL